MQIVIFHYHLNPGGVTRIIESQIVGFKKKYPNQSLKVITGYCENKDFYSNFGVELIIDPILNYLDQKPYTRNELDKHFSTIYNLIKNHALKGDIIHAHNLNLGKNPLVTLAVNQLLGEGRHVFNHAHDFSEDRPNNQAFLHHIINEIFNKDMDDVMYPFSTFYKVGVLNRFDFDRVLEFGIDESRTYLLPNPVYVPINEPTNKLVCRVRLNDTFSISPNKLIITYPVRVIERKNIGELILLASLYTNCQFLVTMAPRNPIEIELYQQWKTFCITNSINVVFEAGEKAAFIDIIAGSDYCITTSKKEGFGMAYLEPWLMGTPVIGRNISYVTSDIKREGIKFHFIYDELLINYKCQTVDFKDLNMQEQQSIIIEVCKGELNIEQIVSLNPLFINFPPKISQSEIEENQSNIKKNFSIEEYARRIHRAYTALPQ